MEKQDVLAAMAALSQETRLDAFRLLVKAGDAGVPAGRIAASLGVASATLSFHLKELRNAGIVHCRREGRSLIYAADYAAVRGVVDYLMDNCCGGVSPPRRRRR